MARIVLSWDPIELQSNLVISNSLISNYRLSRSENLVPFSSFQHYFIYIFLTLGVKLHIHLLNVVVQFIVFLTFSTLICWGTDISKCFSESLGIWDNESRLYFAWFLKEMENFRLENEEGKKITVAELAKLEDAMKSRDREMEKLDEEVASKKKSGRSQDEDVCTVIFAFI